MSLDQPRLLTSAASLGRAIRDVRRSLGLTQAQLGERSGIAQATISKVERGEAHTNLDTLLRLVAVLKLDLMLVSRQAASNVAPWDQGN